MKWIYFELKDWYKEYTKGLEFFPVFVILLVTSMIIICEIYGQTSTYRRHLRDIIAFSGDLKRLMPHLYWFSASFVLYGAIPLLSIVIFRKKFKDFGVQLGDWRLGLKILALFTGVMIVVVLIALQTDSFSRHYPLNKTALNGFSALLIYEFFHMSYFFAWEFVFRGFMLFGLYPYIKNWAILVQMIPFALLHIGKPAPEVFASVFAGLILGALALRTRSFVYCWALHTFSAWAMDFSVFATKGTWSW